MIERIDQLIARIRRDQENVPLVNNAQLIHPPSPTNGSVNPFRMDLINQFAYSQLLSTILRRSKPLQNDKIELITLFENLYGNSESDLKVIRQFAQTYTNHKALWWYTRLTRFNHMLNQAIRTQDISIIFLFQFFIDDLHQQLMEHRCQCPIRTYRTQLLIDDEINHFKESIGSFISTDTFFSTMVDRSRTLHHLDTSDVSNEFHRVLFQIDADPAVVTTRPFADITRYSEFSQEREVLFSIGSLFRVDHIQQHGNQIQIIQMTLCGDDHPDLQPLFKEIERNYGSLTDDLAFVSFSRVLRGMKKTEEAEKYCQRLLQVFSSDVNVLSLLYSELIDIASDKNDSQSTDYWIQKSIQSQTSISSEDLQSMVPSQDNLRFSDIVNEKHEILLPIQGYETMPLATLEEAIEPLLDIVSDIRLRAHVAKRRCENPSDGLTTDQSAAIMLYTMEWQPQEKCLYFILNMHLRTPDRTMLKPWFSYLKLILSGLSRLPSIQRTIYRGVKLDLSTKYPENKEFFWWGFSSCTTRMNVLKSDQFLGKTGARTLFHIECTHGKDIRRHSYYGKEEEILLLPATYFKVSSCFEMASDLHVIQLKEIPSEFPSLELHND